MRDLRVRTRDGMVVLGRVTEVVDVGDERTELMEDVAVLSPEQARLLATDLKSASYQTNDGEDE